MGVVSRPRHTFSGCQCGHTEHVGRNGITGQWPSAACPTCEEIEARESVVLCVESLDRVAYLALAIGSLVRCDGRSYRIAACDEITKLGGRIRTGYVRMKLREVA